MRNEAKAALQMNDKLILYNLTFKRCAIDTNILPNFEVMTNSVSESKLYYTTFPAFKFPDRTNLNIQCSLIICNRTCPQVFINLTENSKYRLKAE